MKEKINLALFYLILALCVFALCFSYNGIDNDLFSRLIQGKSVVTLFHPLYNDVFSYSPTNLWVDHEWLTSAVMYIFQSRFNLLGLIVLKFIFVFLSVVSCVYAVKKLNKKHSPYNFLIWFLFILYMAKFELIYNTLKVQWVSFIFFPLWILCLEKIKEENKKYIYILPLISLIWLNCHGGIIAGIGVLIIYIISQMILKKPLKSFLAAFSLVLITFLINPWGIKYVSFLFSAMSYDKTLMSEWMNVFSPQAKLLNLIVYKSFLIAGFVWIIYKIKNYKIQPLDYSKILTLFTVALFSILHIKHIQLFMIVFIIYCYEDFYDLLNYLLSKVLKNNFKMVTQNAKYVFYLILLIYSVVLIKNVDYKKMVWEDSRSFFPVDCVNFLIQNNLNARVLAPFTISDYISYKGYPNLKVFMNSRYEQLYPMEYLEKSANLFNLNSEKPFDVLFQYPPDIIICENYRPIARDLNILAELGYSLIYRDDFYSAFIINSKRRFSYFYPETLDIREVNHIFDSEFLKNGEIEGKL